MSDPHARRPAAAVQAGRQRRRLTRRTRLGALLGRTTWGLALSFALSLALLVGAARPASASVGSPVVRYRLPVVAPVVDPWRPPSGPYGAGNRGVDLGAEPGTPVVAAADGTVTFAGQVGGRRYVVVRHADGVRTTVGGLDTIWVSAGEVVVAGEVVGIAGGPVHFGARVGTTYVDPLGLLGPVRVWLVPTRGT